MCFISHGTSPSIHYLEVCGLISKYFAASASADTQYFPLSPDFMVTMFPDLSSLMDLGKVIDNFFFQLFPCHEDRSDDFSALYNLGAEIRCLLLCFSVEVIPVLRA